MDKETVMPTYDYRCSICNMVQEVIRQYGEDHKPVCCGVIMDRVWTSNPVIFKGDGFYSTGG